MKYFKTIAAHVISLAFLAFLLTKLELPKLGPVLHSVAWEYFFAAIFINCLSYFAHALRWKSFFNEPQINLSTVFRSVTIGHMFNTILPSKSGELIRPLFLTKVSRISYPNVLATCLVERIIDGFIVLACLGLGVLILGGQGFYTSAWSAPLALLCAALLGLLLLGKLRPFIRFALGKIPQKSRQKVEAFINELSAGSKRIATPAKFKAVMLLSLLYWCLNVWAVWLLLQGLELAPELRSAQVALLIVGALGIALSLPSAPANVGIYHYAVYAVLAFVTENTEGTLGDAGMFIAASILIHLAAVVPDLIIGSLSYYTFPKSLRPKKSEIPKAA